MSTIAKRLNKEEERRLISKAAKKASSTAFRISTALELFATISELKEFHIGHFINSDEIEKEIVTKGFINIEDFDLHLTQADLDEFKKEPNTISLIEKATLEGQRIAIEIKETLATSCTHIRSSSLP